MRLSRIEDLLELLLVLDKEGIEALEGWKLGHAVDLLIGFSPLEVAEPVSRVLDDIDGASGTSQVVSPLVVVHLVAAEENFDSQNEGEKQFVCLEETSAHILVQVLGKVVVEVLYALLSLLTLGTVVNRLPE